MKKDFSLSEHIIEVEFTTVYDPWVGRYLHYGSYQYNGPTLGINRRGISYSPLVIIMMAELRVLLPLILFWY